MSRHGNLGTAPQVPQNVIQMVAASLESLEGRPRMTVGQLVQAILDVSRKPNGLSAAKIEAALGVLIDSGVDVGSYLVEPSVSGRHARESVGAPA